MSAEQDPTHPTGVVEKKDTGGGPNPNVTRSRDRKANAALQLRVEGEDWDEIAEVIGYPTGRAAQVATERALESELREESSQKIMRSMAGKRLEKLLKGVWDKATNGDDPEHLAAVDRARLIIDRHAKLYGLDAPTQVVVSSPSENQLEAWVAEATRHRTPQMTEASIFDDDVVDAEVVDEEKDPVSTGNPEEPDAAPAE